MLALDGCAESDKISATKMLDPTQGIAWDFFSWFCWIWQDVCYQGTEYSWKEMNGPKDRE